MSSLLCDVASFGDGRCTWASVWMPWRRKRQPLTRRISGRPLSRRVRPRAGSPHQPYSWFLKRVTYNDFRWALYGMEPFSLSQVFFFSSWPSSALFSLSSRRPEIKKMWYTSHGKVSESRPHYLHPPLWPFEQSRLAWFPALYNRLIKRPTARLKKQNTQIERLKPNLLGQSSLQCAWHSRRRAHKSYILERTTFSPSVSRWLRSLAVNKWSRRCLLRLRAKLQGGANLIWFGNGNLLVLWVWFVYVTWFGMQGGSVKTTSKK